MENNIEKIDLGLDFASIYTISTKKFIDNRGVIINNNNIINIVKNIIVEEFNVDNIRRGYNIKPEDISIIDNLISISYANTLRGIHADCLKWKLVQCIDGLVKYVIVNMQNHSDGYLKTHEILLNSSNDKVILLPPNIGNAYYCYNNSIVMYTKLYNSLMWNPDDFNLRYYWNFPDLTNEMLKNNWMDKVVHRERNVRYDNPALNINWNLSAKPILSEKDDNGPFNEL